MNKKIFLYFIFAFISTVINLFIQRLVISLNDENQFLFLAIFTGTLFGLITKFYLDKNFIFLESAKKIKNNSRLFALYTLMGLVSTLIFWIIESIFWFTWKNDLMRELGAIIGLTFGYSIKYKLDKRFVFNKRFN